MCMPSQDLPKTAYLKMIDIWMVFTILMMVASMVFHTLVARKVIMEKDTPMSMMSENSVMLKAMAWPVCNKLKKKVFPPTTPWMKQMKKENEELKGAKRLNRAGQVFFIIVVVLFLAGYWFIALKEYFKPAEEYLQA